MTKLNTLYFKTNCNIEVKVNNYGWIISKEKTFTFLANHIYKYTYFYREKYEQRKFTKLDIKVYETKKNKLVWKTYFYTVIPSRTDIEFVRASIETNLVNWNYISKKIGGVGAVEKVIESYLEELPPTVVEVLKKKGEIC